MTRGTGAAAGELRRGLACPERERLVTSATLLTFARTAATLGLALAAAGRAALPLLIAAFAAYWAGDLADGALARWRDEETRIGAVLDICCDRLSAGACYVGLVWYDSTLAVPVGIYLAEFMVVDLFLSLAFLAWPIVSPNYFDVVDRRIWSWNWSKLGKAVNSAAFAVLLLATRNVVLCSAVAVALLAIKLVSLRRLLRVGLPVPSAVRSDRARG